MSQASPNPPQNGTDPGAQMRAEEETLTKILLAKMKRQNCLGDADQEPVAYRISEIMVAAKELYTRDLPRLMQEDEEGEAETDQMFQDLAGLRMTFFNLRDLITDFDEAFLDAMTHDREGEGAGEFAEDEDAEEDEDEDEAEEDEEESESASTADDEAPKPV